MTGLSIRFLIRPRSTVWKHLEWTSHRLKNCQSLADFYVFPTSRHCRRTCATQAATRTHASSPVFKCPDVVAPATELWTTKRDGAVRLRMTESGPGSVQPKTVHTLLRDTANRIPDNPALAVKREGAWRKWTYREYYDDVIRVAKGFIKLGLQPSHGVGIIGFNSPEWFLSNIGAIVAGGLGTGIYTTNTASACEYVLANSAANIVVVENDEQLQKVLRVWSNLPELKAVIQYTGEPGSSKEGVYSWEDFLKLGSTVPDSDLQERISQQSPNKACVLLHTSGTTGNPKGVLQSHDSAVWLSERLVEYNGKITYGKESIVSYLPLSHTFAQTVDMFFMLTIGAEVYFADPDALKGTLVNTLLEVRPTLFIAVPRVVEKFEEKMKDKSLQVKGIKKKIGAWARRKGLEGVYAQINGDPIPFTFNIANRLVLDKVKAQLGLDRVWLAVVGAAPLKRETLDYFFSFNIKFCCGFGMTENAGPACSEKQDILRIGSCGKTFGGCSIKTGNPNENGIGEILINGRHVFMGYIGMETQTKDALNEDGWLKSGDLGYVDKDGFVYITGKIKELLITSGGENVAPVPIEDRVKEELPIVANCMLIGDDRKFITLLITLKVEMDQATGAPTNDLTPEAMHWCRSIGSEAVTLSKLLQETDGILGNAIQAGIDRVNAKAVSRAAYIQKWTILPRDFSIFGGELGPTTKVRRPIVLDMYKDTIDSLYSEA